MDHRIGIAETRICLEHRRRPQVKTNADLDLPPSLHEIIKAVQQLSSGKTPGSDAIPVEIYKHCSPQLVNHLTALSQEIWRQGEFSQGLKDIRIAHLYKQKRNHEICDNHRGISPINIAGKFFVHILLSRLDNHLGQDLLPESQCGFRRSRGTTGMTFAARQLQEMRTHLYSVFVDRTKAFNTVNRDVLGKIMQKFGYPERFTQMMHQLHNDMMARVTDNGAVSEAFAVTNGMKQGCVLAPTIFSIILSAVLMDACRDERPGIRIAYRTDGQLLNRRRMRFRRVYPRPQFTNFSMPTTKPSTPPRKGTCKGAWTSSLPPARTSVCTQQCAADQRERNPTASGGQLPAFGQYPLSQNENRRKSGPPDLKGQSSLRSSSKQSPESSRSSAQPESEDVQGRHPTNAAVWSRDLDGVHEAGTQTQPHPPQLSSPNTGSEAAGPDPRHRRVGSDGNYQQLHHTETVATALQGSPRANGRRQATQTTLLWSCRNGFPPTKRSSLALQGYSEDLAEEPADQPGKLGRPSPEPIYVEDDSKRETRKSQLPPPPPPPPPPPRNVTVQPPPTCPRCQQILGASTGLVGHLRTNCGTRSAPTVFSPSISPTPPTSSTDADRPPRPPLPPSSSSSSSSSSSFSSSSITTIASTSASVAFATPINTTQKPDTPTPPPSTPKTRTWSLRVHLTIALSPHTSTSSVTYESTSRKLANQCLNHQPTLVASASTVHISLAHLFAAWAYLVTCASTKTCGR
ncbi:hypothetical protein SprV_0200786900 [Sparganum proliferum]